MLDHGSRLCKGPASLIPGDTSSLVLRRYEAFCHWGNFFLFSVFPIAIFFSFHYLVRSFGTACRGEDALCLS